MNLVSALMNDEQSYNSLFITSPDMRAEIPKKEVGFFTGSGAALFSGPKHAYNVITSGLTAAADESGVGSFLDSIKDMDSTEWIKATRESRLAAMRQSRSDAETYGVVGQAIHGITSIIPVAVAASLTPAGPAGGVAAVASMTGYDKYWDLRDKGVDHDTAMKGGAITGGVMGLGTALAPYYGQTLSRQVMSGVGINVGLGVGERAGIGSVLEADGYANVAAHYKALDLQAMTVDSILALGFVGFGRWRGGRAAKLADDAPKVPPEAIDDAMTAELTLASKRNVGEVPTTHEAMEYESARHDEFAARLHDGENPRDIAVGSPHPDTVPNPKIADDVITGARAIVAAHSDRGIDLSKVLEQNTAIARIMSGEDATARVMDEAPRIDEAMPKDGEAQRLTPEDIAKVTPEDFEGMQARRTLEDHPNMKVIDETGNEVSATKALDDLDAETKVAKIDGSLHHVYAACALTRGL